mmetsp:Transcript_30595/g.95085  ORF Transcript_30595/g.95085 Transcript_30595/m.95085 type:complete len:226 (-) Transcript_30595:633-1310(-)
MSLESSDCSWIGNAASSSLDFRLAEPPTTAGKDHVDHAVGVTGARHEAIPREVREASEVDLDGEVSMVLVRSAGPCLEGLRASHQNAPVPNDVDLILQEGPIIGQSALAPPAPMACNELDTLLIHDRYAEGVMHVQGALLQERIPVVHQWGAPLVIAEVLLHLAKLNEMIIAANEVNMDGRLAVNHPSKSRERILGVTPLVNLHLVALHHATFADNAAHEATTTV